ncbi:dTDP-4-dehydrorhamnose reductase [Methanosphaera cuniculi]|uniref:NAD(P)-dependent oxidoreductase n=1 Tax=Methanosphaera cuniculi TaxID=1077256 RepID=A0A2A2HCG7_9EURY|nr:dTDP-4-dehydrorhamnose reductase [Methanosphaera cuniculi]PAV07020.1 NAD(P)-dependent oxidoreductase [Methanosphaera cuniculi]PWL08909.1 dTDP-4-dehydrorhamnose reductase [Methanosphaera cuniculi]
MKFFITGGSGLLGERLATVADPDDELILSHNSNKTPDTVKCDITNHDETYEAIMKYDPDVIIHAAAMTNVDLCEDEIDQAYKINADATGNLAKIADENNMKIIYVSTDFVFDGKKGNYKEDDATNPLGIYAKSKYDGEVQLKQNTDNYAIGRVSVLYGWHQRSNFTTWVIDELRKGNSINIVTDQINSPTYADNAAEALFKLAKSDKTGVYHTAGNDLISRYDFTLKIAEAFNLDSDLINPITSDKFVQKAPRPRDSSLNVKKIEDELDFRMETCCESLKRMADDEL